MPQPVGIAQFEGSVIVVCEDGAVYRCEQGFQVAPEEAHWVMLPPVPNSEFQERLQRISKQEDGGLQWMGTSPRGEEGGPQTLPWPQGTAGTRAAPFRARSTVPRRKAGGT